MAKRYFRRKPRSRGEAPNFHNEQKFSRWWTNSRPGASRALISALSSEDGRCRFFARLPALFGDRGAPLGRELSWKE